jgi:hypothetical protein
VVLIPYFRPLYRSIALGYGTGRNENGGLGTPIGHFIVQAAASLCFKLQNPIIGLDLRAGTLERYIVVLDALLFWLRFLMAMTI